MSESHGSDNARIATEHLAQHHAATAQVLSLLDLQRWFADELKRRPSVTTLAKARKAFIATLGAPDPKTEEMRAFEKAFASAIAPYRERAEEAERVAQDALRAADVVVASAEQSLLVAQQRFDVLLADAAKRADNAELARSAASDATDKSLSQFSDQLQAANKELANTRVQEATALSERDGALAEAINLKQCLEAALTENARLTAAHAEAMTAERTRSDARETRASEQMSETTRHWATQVNALRTELAELARKLAATEAALLNEKATHEKALVRARQESINAVSDEIKRLSDAIGGVNALYNTHLGAVRSQVEALTESVMALVRHLDGKTISQPGALSAPTPLQYTKKTNS